MGDVTLNILGPRINGYALSSRYYYESLEFEYVIIGD